MPTFTVLAHCRHDAPDSPSAPERIFGRFSEHVVARHELSGDALKAFLLAAGRPGPQGFRVEPEVLRQHGFQLGAAPPGLSHHCATPEHPDALMRYERLEPAHGQPAGPLGTLRLALSYQASGCRVNGVPVDEVPRWVLHFGDGLWSYRVEPRFLATLRRCSEAPADQGWALDIGARIGFRPLTARQVLRFLADYGFVPPADTESVSCAASVL